MKKTIFSLFVLLLVISGCATKNDEIQQTQTSKSMQAKNVMPIDINKNDFIGELSIHDAVRSKDVNIVKFLVSQNSQLNDKDKYGYTPLHLAVRANELEIVELLFKGGAKVNSKDNYGDTPLIDFTRNKFTKVSEFLICNGASRNVSDDHERTPLNYAAATKDLYIVNMLIESSLASVCGSEAQLSINTMDDVHVQTPTICGTYTNILTDIKVSVQAEDETKFGPYTASINSELKTWCITVSDSLNAMNYNATATATSLSKKDLQDIKAFKIEMVEEKEEVSEIEEPNKNNEILHSLYEALHDEFQDDFEAWDAALDEESLTFRFKSPHLMFEHGNSKLKTKYKDVLSEFFPRYVKILEDYETYVQSVFVEGHTSSEYKLAKTDQEKFDFNMALSERRAQKVVKYISNISSVIVHESKNWINEIFIPVGKSSLELIKNEDGSENQALSRRVDFRIKTVPSDI